jgi:anti-sigma B factor antagonist
VEAMAAICEEADMTITSKEAGPVTVVVLQGKMTADESNGKVREQIDSLIQKGRKQIVANLEAVSTIDSGGLGELVSCYATTNRVGGSMRLVYNAKKIKDLMIITKLAAVFDSYDTEAEAIRSFGAAV